MASASALSDIDTALRWPGVFTKVGYASKVIKVIDGVDPLITMKFEKVFSEFLQTLSLEQQNLIEYRCLASVCIQHPNLSKQDYGDIRLDLCLEKETPEMQYQYHLDNKLAIETSGQQPKWLTKSAERGYAPAQLLLGQWFLEIQPTHDMNDDNKKIISKNSVTDVNKQNLQDNTKAFYWISKAAKQNYISAKVILGVCYRDGIGVTKHEKNAFDLFTDATNQDHDPMAQFTLAECYAGGIGTEKNDEIAFRWYLESAKQNFVEGQYIVGLCFENGTGVEKNNKSAIRWYSKSADQGFTLAKFKLKLYFQTECNDLKNDKEAFELYKNMANQGHAEAQFWLAFCFENGIGIEKNDDEANKWYTKAVNKDYNSTRKERVALLNTLNYKGYRS